MATASSNSDIPESFYEDFDDILELCDDDFFDNDDEITLYLNEVVSTVEKEVVKDGFACAQCKKICKSKQGLSRHVNSMHNKIEGKTLPKKPMAVVEPESKLHPGTYLKIVRESAKKLSVDECYSDSTRDIFCDFNWTHEEALLSYSEIRELIKKFKGNGEKFYPEFYDIVCTKPLFPKLSKKCSRLLGCEVANHVLCHLSGNKNPIPTNNDSVTVEFSDKEKNIITYLSGYVFNTIHKRLIRPTTKNISMEVKENYVALLLAGKSLINTRADMRLTVARDRGGLWIMEPFVVQIFEEAERYFRKNVIDQSTTKIDGKEIVSALLTNSYILSCFSILRNKCSEKISKELALNLLQDLLTLFVRARTFSYVKQKRDKFKLENKVKKMKSLRTSIKKASESLEMGH